MVFFLCLAALKLASELKFGKAKLRQGLLVVVEANLTLLESSHCLEVRISKLRLCLVQAFDLSPLLAQASR